MQSRQFLKHGKILKREGSLFLIKEFNLAQVPLVDEDLWEFCLHFEAHCQEEYFIWQVY